MMTIRPALGGACAVALLATLTVLATPAHATHVTCGSVITGNTTLDSDVGPCPGDGIIVGADNITLDLNGHRIFAANGEGDNAGIRLPMRTGVTVTNGTVEGFDAGVVIGGGSGNTVIRMIVQDNVNDFLGGPCDLGDGIVVNNSDANTIQRNLAARNGPYGGITLLGDADGNVVRQNHARDNNIVGTNCGNSRQDEGIRIEGPGANDNQIVDNQVSGSLLAGIGLHGHVCENNAEPGNYGNVVTRNQVSTTGGSSVSAGINFLQQGPAGVVCPASETTVTANTSRDNDGDGIFVAASSFGNQINRNYVANNNMSGIYLNGPRFANQFTNVGPTLFDVVSPDRPPYVEGTDYQVMSGSGSGDVTGELVAIDIAVPNNDPVNPNPVDTSTSGCEQADYDAAGFEPGDVALIQRGTCTFVSKVNLAIANGASAVVMFNEGQTNRTSANFGGVGPVTIPVLSTTYAVGQELYTLTQAGEVIVHIITNTTNVETEAAPGAHDNVLLRNRGVDNGEFDGFDGNLEPPCDNNRWFENQFATVNQPCVAEPFGPTTPVTPKARPSSVEQAPTRPDSGLMLTDRSGATNSNTPAAVS